MSLLATPVEIELVVLMIVKVVIVLIIVLEIVFTEYCGLYALIITTMKSEVSAVLPVITVAVDTLVDKI